MHDSRKILEMLYGPFNIMRSFIGWKSCYRHTAMFNKLTGKFDLADKELLITIAKWVAYTFYTPPGSPYKSW